MRLKRGVKSERGDTIIEVIFAVVIFALVAVGSLAIMNQGIATGERSLEISLVRLQINAQAEALRYVHDVTVSSPTSLQAATWASLIGTYKENSASSYGASNNSCVLPNGSNYKPFILNARTAKVWSSAPSIAPANGTTFPPYSQVIYNTDSSISSIKAAYGLWVEAVPSTSFAATRFVDFHIRACWPGPGSSVPITIGTIVRLYDPS